jgi:peptidoglycan hydrolase-like protein with peptidoglycan-binding domain
MAVVLCRGLAVMLLSIQGPGGASAAENGWTQFMDDLKALGRAVSGQPDPAPPETESAAEPELIPLFVKEPEFLSKPVVKPQPVPAVAEAQSRLNRLGYEAGPEDGLMGRRTRSALEAFQRTYGLPVTGRPDRATRGLLEAFAASPGGASTASVSRAPSTADRPSSGDRHRVPDVRRFEFRGVTLGATVDDVRAAFGGLVLHTEAQSVSVEPQLESYFGVDYENGMSFRFDRQSSLFRVNSTQVLERSVTPRMVYERFLEKYGPANQLSEFREGGQEGRFQWSTRESGGEAILEVKVRASATDNLTRIHATLRDEAAARRNRQALSRAARNNARNRPAARDVQL